MDSRLLIVCCGHFFFFSAEAEAEASRAAKGIYSGDEEKHDEYASVRK